MVVALESIRRRLGKCWVSVVVGGCVIEDAQRRMLVMSPVAYKVGGPMTNTGGLSLVCFVCEFPGSLSGPLAVPGGSGSAESRL